MFVKYALLPLFIATVLQLSCQASLPSDPTYNAAVVEFAPAKNGTTKDRLKNNLMRFKEIIESNVTLNLDILVFPEYVLNNMDMKTYVPDPALKISPCDITDYDYFLTEISCSVRSRGVYVVLNLLEKEMCEDSALGCEPGLNTYNTNVVFDRQGRVISRYRKTHLYRYEWYDTNVLSKPELATFTTDFGVTFGHFICFDMLFYEPAQVLIQEKNVTDIIYPTYWFSELPFLTAVQLQEGFAYGSNVNLLAADASYPAGQNTGSGIYAGKLGRLTAAIHEVPTTKVLTATVPKRAQHGTYQLPPVVEPLFVPQLETPRFTKMSLLRDYNVDIFSTKLLEENFTTAVEMLCNGDFCCDFSVRRTLITASAAHSAYRYRLAAYSGGERSTHQRMDPSDLSICAIIACTNAELYSCGHIFPEAVTVGNKFYFSALNISGSFRTNPRRLIMPSTVDAQIMPLSVNQYDMTEVHSSNSIYVSIGLTSPKADLLTFGIWANYYSNDVSKHNLDPAMPVSIQENTASAGTKHTLVGLWLAALAAARLSL